MKHSLKQQSGITFLGLCFVLSFIAIVVVFVLRLFPLYNEKFQVEAAMQTVASQPDASRRSLAETRSALLKALAVTNITRFNDKTVRDLVTVEKPAKSGEPPMLHVKYQATNKLFADLQLMMEFDKQLPMGTTGAPDGN